MSQPFSLILKSALALVFACSAIPAFAQHGGGGHGGGGGGFHGGGGGMRSSGGSAPRGGGSSSSPTAGYGSARGASPSGPRFGNGYAARQGNNFSRPGGNYSNGNQRVGNSPSTPGAAADGQWHSFGGGRGPAGAQSQAGPSNSAGGFHVFSGNRGAAPNSAARSFSGQGGEVWENSPASRNMVSKSQSLSTLHNSFVGSRAATAGLRPNASLSASSRFAGGSALVGNRGVGGNLNAANPLQPLRGSNRFGVPFGGNRGGCWNCGIGFGGWGNRWGWGFGWPGLGFWGLGWDPFIYDPWWGSGIGMGYGYYGYPNNYIDPGPGYYGPDYNSAPPEQQQQDNSYDEDYQGNSNGNSNGNWITPNEPSASSAQRSSSMAVPVLIYMKSGKILTVRDYWMVDDELHYILMSGVQNSADLEQVDLPRTNTENAKSGVKFIFKSEPSAAPPPSGPAPTQELNAVPEPEATT